MLTAAPESPKAARTLRSKVLIGGGAAFLALCLTALSACWYMGVFGENFRAIVPNQAYRSGQVTPETIRKHAKEDSIKTIVNLRGQSKSAWYSKELQACQEAGIAHYDVKFDPGYLPSPERLKQLIDVFEKAPTPMLLHCRAGSDRSGLGSALYDLIVMHKTLDEAIDAQMTWRVGHVKKDSGDQFLELYRANGNGKNIKEWISSGYPEIYKRIERNATEQTPGDDAVER